MHPILVSWQRQTLYLASWGLIGLLLAAVYSTTNPAAGFFIALAIVAPPGLLYAFVCLSAWYVCRAAPLAARSVLRILAVHTGAAVVAAAAWTFVWIAWSAVLAGHPAFAEAVREGYRSQLAVILAAGVLLFWLSSMLHYLLIAFETSRRAEARELGFSIMAREAELKALRAQIDPHFLFNSLQSISALTSTDPAGARKMCLLLADFFRSGVRLGARDRILLEEEMEMVRAFLDIERVRFGPRLSSEVVLDPGCATCLIPPLILQPLVENAVRHGIHTLVDGGVVGVSARCDADTVHLRVRNPVDTDAPEQTGAGVGLDNVRRRLAAAFNGATETRWRRERGVFLVDIRFPREDGARERRR